MVACAAGSEFAIYSVKDGHEVYKRDFGQSIVSLEPATNLDGSEFFAIVFSDGSLDMLSPLLPIQAQGTSLRASVPYQIDMASSGGLKENGLVVTLMRPAEQHARLLSYTFDVVNADDTTSYTLDELLDQAHQLID